MRTESNWKVWLTGIGLVFFCTLSCISIEVPGQVTFLGSGSIVLKGITVDSATDACPVWKSDRGEMFVLFQDSKLSNEDFDAVVAPGVQSRLMLQGRPDLGEVCLEGAENAVVLSVLEIDGVDQTESKFDELQNRSEALVDEVRAGLAARRDEIAGELEDSFEDLESRAQSLRVQLEANLQGAIDDVRDNLADAEPIDDRLNQFADTLRGQVNDAVEQIGNTKENLRDQIDARIEELATALRLALDESRDRLRQNFGQRLPNNGELIAQFRIRIASIQQRLEGDFDLRGSELRDQLNELGSQFEDDLGTIVDRLIGQISSQTSDADNTLLVLFDEHEVMIDQVVDQIAISRASLQEQIRAALQSRLNMLEIELRQALPAAVDTILAELAIPSDA